MERYEKKEIGRFTVTTQFFGNSFGKAAIGETERSSFEHLHLNEDEVNDLHYALGRIIAKIAEAKQHG